MTLIDREDFIVLIKSGVSDKVMKLEFDLSDEDISSLRKSISIRDELVRCLEGKDSLKLQKLIGKYRKKDVLVDYVASFSENKENEFFKGLDNNSKTRFSSLLEEYNIKLEKPQKREISEEINKDIYVFRKSPKSLSDEEIEVLRINAESGTINQKNIFAFTLFKSGRIDEARNYLMGIIDSSKSYTAYRQLIYLEKSEGNYEDAKIWALDADEQFPNNLGIKEVQFRIARDEKDVDEMIAIAKQIRGLSPDAKKYEDEALRYKAQRDEK